MKKWYLFYCEHFTKKLPSLQQQLFINYALCIMNYALFSRFKS
ncbi:MAG: hypothetical protein J6R17_00680 [Bacteroidales bacterium]|nr:hypothetical protein [Bacteroidales bacterium]